MENIESMLSVDWDFPRVPYPAKVVTLPTGDKMVIREISREEVPKILDTIRPLITVAADYYDIVSARVTLLAVMLIPKTLFHQPVLSK